ncbi:tannase/feruloyl esterase [Novosphingobium sp. PhB165]|uniref:tannase/feruloyl esterase family alpha/beta hydrolase n=1 Tax=Novosphingobium sp. PhB165 TaxID=2485105 RepID=UPI0010E47901|nr:tannase/feruloyl esterase family alpha/beta hydrolase [Novosphingobium sp. PhB165]TCM20736.1 tannase/feruloyl esterase [Novosphingobium sp. PhB165]
MSDNLVAAIENDDLTRIVLIRQFKKGESLVIDEPASPHTPVAPSDLCLVKLIVGPGNPGPEGAPSTSPGIGIEVWLPSREAWNGRIHNIGGLGGFDGGQHSSPHAVGWPYAALTAGSEGSLSASTDSGHTLTNGAWAMNPDGTPARQLWEDYAHRAMHVMAEKTKQLAQVYYGKPAHHAYYEGVSTGGRHGYRLAQEYPGDYDGIIASLPALNWAQWVTADVYRSLAVERELGGHYLTKAQMDLVSNAAIASCDTVGGQHMGYVTDNAACIYDPTKDKAVLRVEDGGTNAGPDALSLAQARVVNQMWYGITSDGSAPDPARDNGVGTELSGPHKWYGLMRGTSLYQAYFANIGYGSSNAHEGYVADQVALDLGDPRLANPTFHNASANGEAGWTKLTYEELARAFDRGTELDETFGRLASDDPDLSAFKARGGKFLSWHGWNDEAIPVQGTIRYYDRVLETMGGPEQVHDFFRLYLLPGVGHMSPNGTSNPEAHPPLVAPGQFFALMVDWVENGKSPDDIIIETPADSPIRRSAPIAPYPRQVRYAGGNPNEAASYEVQ